MVTFTQADLDAIFKRMSELRVLLIGDAIIDEYVFVDPVGRATKDPVLVSHVKRMEQYAGGVFATARHLAQFVREVTVLTVLGTSPSHESLIRAALPSNVKLVDFSREGTPTTTKRAYLDAVHSKKMFKVTWIDESRYEDELIHAVAQEAESLARKHDMLLVNDFGHGLVDDRLIATLERAPLFLGINVQANSANYGFNLVNKFNRADFVSLNQTEIRLLFHTRDKDNRALFDQFIKMKQYRTSLLTLGREGCIYFRTHKNEAPAFIVKPVDTIGAGDATFAITSVLSYLDVPESYVPYLANAVGASAALTVGNKESVTAAKMRHVLFG